MKNKNIIEIIEFTDPVCTWCWGSEPLLRKLETRYGDPLQVKFIMGGLVEDIRSFYDSRNDIGLDPANSNRQIARHWLEASQRHGMPVLTEGFSLFSDEAPSTYPQNIAYKALQMESEVLANRFLRRIREATAAQARQTNKLEVMIELAAEVGADLSKFLERYSDGTAETAFRADLALVRKYGVRGFPTFLVRFGEKEVLLRGYQNFESIKSVIKSLSGESALDQAPEKTEENLIAFVKKYNRVAPVEIQEAFELSQEEVHQLMTRLEAQKQIRITPAGNGFWVETQSEPMSCDNAGFCCF
jgi:predicted DsbA family dithiol-disulfide isomerase